MTEKEFKKQAVELLNEIESLVYICSEQSSINEIKSLIDDICERTDTLKSLYYRFSVKWRIITLIRHE